MIPVRFATALEARVGGYIPKVEAARILNVHPVTLLQKARKGQAPSPIRVGQAFWFLEEEVRAWAADRPARHKLIGPPRRCAAPGCPHAELAKGLCGAHYRRERLTGVVHERFVGEPVRGGYWGVVDENESGVLCYECGRRFQNLGVHVSQAHDMSAREYKDRYGIPRSRSLASRRLREANRDRALRMDLASGLDGHRDGRAGAAARTRGSLESLSRTGRQAGLDAAAAKVG